MRHDGDLGTEISDVSNLDDDVYTRTLDCNDKKANDGFLTTSCSGNTNSVELPDFRDITEKKDPGNGSMQRIYRFDGKKQEISKGPPWFKSQRYILTFILFGVVMNIFLQRATLNFAIVCMVNHTATNPSTSTHTVLTSNLRVASESPQQQQKTSMFSDESGLPTTSTVRKSHEQQQQISHAAFETDEGSLTTATGNKRVAAKFPLQQHATKTNDTTNTSVTNLPTTAGFDSPTATESVLQNHSARNAAGMDNMDLIQDGPFRWDKKTQALLLGALYWTYLVSCLPADALIRNTSKKRVVSVSVGIMTAVTLLIPVSAWLSPWVVFAIKLIQGVCSPLSMLGIYGMLGQWAPPQERTFLVSLAFTGIMCSNVVVFPVSGYLCDSGFLGGWPSIFYVFGGVGLLWTLVFVVFTADSPASHPSITAEEAHYIETSLSNSIVRDRTAVPWGALLRSPAVWGVLLLNWGYSWGLFLLMATLPQYMKEVLKFNIDSNGLYLMLPYLAMLVVASASGPVCNAVIKCRVIPLVWVRKIAAVIGNAIPALLLIVVGFQDSTQSHVAVALLTLAVGILGISPCVIFNNPFDVAPPFAQSISAISTLLGAINGIVTPYMVAAITQDKTKSQWQTVFYLSSGVMISGTLAFCIMGQANVQPWAMPKEDIDISISTTKAVQPQVPHKLLNGGKTGLRECLVKRAENNIDSAKQMSWMGAVKLRVPRNDDDDYKYDNAYADIGTVRRKGGNTKSLKLKPLLFILSLQDMSFVS